jgi:GWxTD domain-containing protein
MSSKEEPPVNDEITSLASLWTARLLRLRPLHGPRPTGQRVRDPLEAPRWALSLALLLLLLLFLAMLAFFFVGETGAADTSINFDKATKDWYQGPVRYIITHQEVKAYKALETELDRQNFIDWFWDRRDITPGTEENEFRDRYQQRVFEATRMFGDTSKPGWKTDMGKIYILVGPPDDINKDIMAKTHRGMVFWVYRRPPFPEMVTNTVISFAKDKSGEFVLSTTPTIDSDVARGLNFVDRFQKDSNGDMVIPYKRDPALVMQGVPLSQGPLETMMIAGRMQQVPPAEAEMFKSFAVTREFFNGIPTETRCDFYKAGDGSTYTTVTVGIKSTAVQYRTVGKKEQPDVVVFGKLTSKENPSEVYALAGDNNFAESVTNQEAGVEDLLVFQATAGMKPGKYELLLGVQDRVSKKLSSFKKEVVIPDYASADLSLSSITLARDMEPIDIQTSPGKPFHMGKFRLVPSVDAVFRKASELNVYFQVYGPVADPETGKFRLDVDYHFRSKSPDGSFADFGGYSVKGAVGQVQGYAVALQKWPAGDYEVAVTVKDLVSGKSASGSAPFSIRD